MKPIISVKEARKLLGKDAETLTDEEVEKLVSDLEWLAKLSIEQYKKERASDQWLLEWANFLYCRYVALKDNP